MDKLRLISDNGLDVLKRAEGFRAKAYQDDAGVWTIGYGHTKGVKAGDLCTEAQALAWLNEDLDEAEAAVRDSVVVSLTTGQQDALIVFAFNIGVGAFEGSTLLRKLNNGEYVAVPTELRRWNKVRDKATRRYRVSDGLIARREKEIALWLGGAPGPASTGARPVPPATPTITGAAGTDTGKGAITVGGAVIAAGTVLQTAAPYFKTLDDLARSAPIALAIVGALAAIGVIIWRSRRD